ncbi:transposase [Pandoraea iniqua]|uniref:Transposase n=1 Tax=Pandoraea iniqua TaxID=2508288 RepID=A0A5E4YDX6_9BURK|nr:transposase [Pandoraea iniqua]
MSTERFTPEFKEEAVRQIVERGHSVAEVSARLGSQPLKVGQGRSPLTKPKSKRRNWSRPRARSCGFGLNSGVPKRSATSKKKAALYFASEPE